MPDLFLIPDERYLLTKWDQLAAVFRIVARDYQRVLVGDAAADRHRTILIQTVSDLLDLETDLFRLGKDRPAIGQTAHMEGVWQAATAWVRQLREWRLPHESMPMADIEHSLVCRKLAEEQFNATVCDGGAEPVSHPTMLVHGF